MMKISKYDMFRDNSIFLGGLTIDENTKYEDFEKFVKTSLELYLEYENVEYGVYITEKLCEYGETESDLVYIFECMQNNNVIALDRMFLEN